MAKYCSYLCKFLDSHHRTMNDLLPNRSKSLSCYQHFTECFTCIRVGIMNQYINNSPCYCLLRTKSKQIEIDSLKFEK